MHGRVTLNTHIFFLGPSTFRITINYECNSIRKIYFIPYSYNIKLHFFKATSRNVYIDHVSFIYESPRVHTSRVIEIDRMRRLGQPISNAGFWMYWLFLLDIWGWLRSMVPKNLNYQSGKINANNIFLVETVGILLWLYSTIKDFKVRQVPSNGSGPPVIL